MSSYPAISDYAFLSDCASTALIGRDASVEWACFGRVDARPVFAALLDRQKGGFFRIAPAGDFEASRCYLPDTNVLETRFETASGSASVVDCLPVFEDLDEPGRLVWPDPPHVLLRVVRGDAGSVDMALDFRPRFDYGLTTPYVKLADGDFAVVTGGPDSLLLQSELGPLEHDEEGCRTAATVRAGDELFVALTHAPAGELRVRRLPRDDLRTRLEKTTAFWSSWAGRCTYDGPHRDAVVRGALALKGLTHARTGAVVAAATTSLPEEIGGERNWDYRFSWLRDSAALLAALARIGYLDEGEQFARWLGRTTAGRASELQILYGIGGERLLHEAHLDHLEGYRGSRPVRIGNGAWDQFQLDTYGELLAATWFVRSQRERTLDPRRQAFLRDVVEEAVRRRDEPDEGIWEVRGGRRHFVYSKLMVWVALDRGIHLLEPTPELADLERWRALRDEVRREIETQGVDPDTGAFLQSFGSDALDASALQIPLMGFLPFEDPRVRATIDGIDRDLTRNGHVYRYLDRKDGLSGEEGAFVFCTLWLVRCLALSGQVDRAEQRLQLVLDCANDLGLLAEEIDPDTGAQLGNYPQAFSHVGVIHAALAIDRARRTPSPA